MPMTGATRRRASGILWTVGWLALILLIGASAITAWTDGRQSPVGVADPVATETGHRVSAAQPSERFQVKIRRPSGPPTIELKQPDSQGHIGRVACSTCHSIREPNMENRKPSDLNEFHQGMPLMHGQLACYACHNPDDSDTLRLADGSVVQYVDVMDLCAQCHGVQARYYAKGLHGGMNGYWDLSRGGRVRNNCIDCHDPHVPKFPMMQPTFKPRDRFLEPSVTHGPMPHESDESEVDHE